MSITLGEAYEIIEREGTATRVRSPYTPPKQNKYYNKVVFETPGGQFVGKDHEGPKKKIADSRKEFKRLQELKSQLAFGMISFFRTQVRFKLHGPNGTVLTSYVADFSYVRDGKLVVEDTKSSITKTIRLYQIKRAWVKDEYNIDIVEL